MDSRRWAVWRVLPLLLTATILRVPRQEAWSSCAQAAGAHRDKLRCLDRGVPRPMLFNFSHEITSAVAKHTPDTMSKDKNFDFPALRRRKTSAISRSLETA